MMRKLINGHRPPKYVYEYRSKGHSYLYFVRDGDRVRLGGELGSAQFDREYKLALNGVMPLSQTFDRTTARPNSIALRQAARAPKIGVYLLFLKGAVVYVGSSMNMPERVKAHRTNGRPFDRVYFIKTLPVERAVVERALIAAFIPPQNRAGKNVRLDKFLSATASALEILDVPQENRQ